MFLNQLSVLRHPRDPAIAGPVRGGVIAESDVDVCVIVDLVEFVGGVVGDEVQR